jgi:hypothetical protein
MFGSIKIYTEKYLSLLMEINIELLLNLPNLRILDCVVSDKEAHIHCEFTENFGVCLVCQKKLHKFKCIRNIQFVIWHSREESFLYLKTPQFHCNDCSRYFNESFNFVDKNCTK